MSFIDEIKSLGANDRAIDEIYYAEVLREIQAGKKRDGLWSRALAETDFDENKAKAKYIKLRVQSLKDEVSLSMKLPSNIQPAPQLTKTSIRNQPKPPQENSNIGCLLMFPGVLLGALLGCYIPYEMTKDALDALQIDQSDPLASKIIAIAVIIGLSLGIFCGAAIAESIGNSIAKKTKRK